MFLSMAMVCWFNMLVLELYIFNLFVKFANIRYSKLYISGMLVQYVGIRALHRIGILVRSTLVSKLYIFGLLVQYFGIRALHWANLQLVQFALILELYIFGLLVHPFMLLMVLKSFDRFVLQVMFLFEWFKHHWVI